MSKVEVHPLFLFIALSSVLTGLFKEFIIMFSIIIIHEIGHLITAYYYKSNINKIYLYPFGGYISFGDKINKPLKEEFLILISGPILQIIYFFIMLYLNYISVISLNTYNIIINYHYTLLFFNMLPLFPLDGSKLINILLSKLTSFKLAHKIMLYISYIGIIFFLFTTKYINFGMNLYLMLSLLLVKVVKESRNHKMVCNRFLLERYLYNFKFNKLKIISGSNLSKMMRDRRHLFIIGDKKVTEKDLLKQRYGKKGKDFTKN